MREKNNNNDDINVLHMKAFIVSFVVVADVVINIAQSYFRRMICVRNGQGHRKVVVM